MKSSCPQLTLLSHLNVTLELFGGILKSDLPPLHPAIYSLFFHVVILPALLALSITQVREAKHKTSHHESEEL